MPEVHRYGSGPEQRTSYAGSLTLHVRESKGQPTHSFVFLHGYDCSGKGDAAHFDSWAHANTTAYPGLRVVCPTAHLLKTSAPGYGDKRVHSWYDFHNGKCTSPDEEHDMCTLEASCAEIHAIVRAEAELVGSLSRVFVGGVSQGCGTALHAVATLPPMGSIGGFYGSIGHVMPCTDVSNLADRVAGPIVFYCGANDRVMSWSWVKPTFERLDGVPRVEIWREDKVGHVDDGHWIANFLMRVLPPPGVREQLRAYDFRAAPRHGPMEGNPDEDIQLAIAASLRSTPREGTADEETQLAIAASLSSTAREEETADEDLQRAIAMSLSSTETDGGRSAAAAPKKAGSPAPKKAIQKITKQERATTSPSPSRLDLKGSTIIDLS